jgi:hypothetical protein
MLLVKTPRDQHSLYYAKGISCLLMQITARTRIIRFQNELEVDLTQHMIGFQKRVKTIVQKLKQARQLRKFLKRELYGVF